MPNQALVDAIRLHPADNVGVAVRALAPNQPIDVGGTAIVPLEPIPAGHKVALGDLSAGDPVIRYGQPIGLVTRAARRGSWVHVHNLAHAEGSPDLAPASEVPAAPQPLEDRTFQGYRRGDGRAGTRNYIAVISTVNCSASVSQHVARRFDAAALRDYPQVDGVVAFTHQTGCGMPLGGTSHEMLNRVLAGLIRQPNIGGCVLIGLGCEQAVPALVLDHLRLVPLSGYASGTTAPPVFSLQDAGGTVKTVEAAVKAVAAMLPQVNAARRETLPASLLTVGLECGGSDGNSGITANPAVGVASDLVVACGGTAILSETPEICGAEHLLTRRAVSREVAERLVERVRWWKWYTGLFGARVDNNPSLGNKEGGLTTIAEKSLGAVAKAGSTALVDVYEYAQQVTAKGLVFMDTPGFDPASVTGMVAGGANVILFTTGRGSCFGCKPSPSIKIATNTPMFERMIDDMDVDAGGILAGRSVDEVGREIFAMILDVASGRKTSSERHGLGDEEFVPWTIGPVL